MTGPQSTDAGTNPPQLLAVAANDEVVTLGIAGNDIDFTGIVENCIGRHALGANQGRHGPARPTTTRPATTSSRPRSRPCGLGSRPRWLKIHARAPQAKVFLVGYPAILPTDGIRVLAANAADGDRCPLPAPQGTRVERDAGGGRGGGAGDLRRHLSFRASRTTPARRSPFAGSSRSYRVLWRSRCTRMRPAKPAWRRWYKAPSPPPCTRRRGRPPGRPVSTESGW